MIVTCPQCQTQIDAGGAAPGQTILCKRCQIRLALPAAAGPIYIPVPSARTRNPLDFNDTDEDLQEERSDRREQLGERREARHERREERKIRGLEREGNMVGIAALATAGTTGLLVLSGLLFVKSLSLFAGIAGSLGVIGALASLVLGFIGVLRPGRSRTLSGIATGIGAVLILFLIPLLWVTLTQKP